MKEYRLRKMMKIKSKKISLFTDIHWGHNKDNVNKLKYTQEFVKYFIKENKKRDIDTVFFLGDFFDNQNSINIQTMNVAYANLKMLCKFFHVYMILGNHDLFLKDNTKIHSIKPFSEIPNLKIISENTIVDFNGKSGMLCPWGFETIDKDLDYLFGHFNFNGAELCGSIFNGGNYSMADLNKIAPLVFSGHFHIRKEYHTKHGKIITLGNPLEKDWGDYNNTKGFYILDTQTSEYEFIENTFSPKHLKILWSEKYDINFDIIKDNYIKLVVDEEYQYQDVLGILNEIKLHNPLTANIEYIFSVNKNLLGEIKVSKKEINMDKISYIHKFLDSMEKQVEQEIDWTSVKNRTEEYYKAVGE